eukprot:TRINITY_DN17594_c0_g1_i1.p1 TRINITY_DN17594_c0_g1~~TRINITY_DN17594_c0_g1_i1.p1  ORF type:complete len:521 (-),score=107.29 TRINITY_DN17594_c0_g1_i1:125-1687(-)
MTEPTDPAEREADLIKCPEWVTTKLLSLEEESLRLATEEESLRRNIEKLLEKDRVSTEKLQKEIENLREKIAVIIGPVKGKRKEYKQLEDEITNKDNEIDKLKEQIRSHRPKVPDLKTENIPLARSSKSARKDSRSYRTPKENRNSVRAPLSPRIDEPRELIERNSINTFDDFSEYVRTKLQHAELTPEIVNANISTITRILIFQRIIGYKDHDNAESHQNKFYADVDPEQENELAEELLNPKKAFRIQTKVGSGGFGTVYSAKQGNKMIAIKKAPHMTIKERQVNYHEISYLRQIKHENIVEMYKAYLVESEIWIAMEFLEGGTLTEAVKKQDFRPNHIAFVAHGVLEGLKYLHASKIAHRDLKSANIMLSVKAEVKIVDFGLCCKIEEPRFEIVGSPFWMPPEMILSQPHTYAVDIWSLGISLLELANGDPPNRDNSLKAMAQIAINGIPKPFKEPTKWPGQFHEFIAGCLKTDPQERPTAADLLTHEFIKLRAPQQAMRSLLSKIFVAGVLNALVEI